jgi:peptidoglycan hydrolase-like protein with peptidoglycan-binding domain
MHGGFYAAEKPPIRKIQLRPQELGFAPTAAGWADGIYEQPTVGAVKKFQVHKGLPATGTVNAATWNAVFGP